MSNVIVYGQAAVDTRVEIMAPFFGPNLKLTDPDWWCSEVEETVGSEPSTAIIKIPNKQGVRDDVHWSVALNPDGPDKDMKRGAAVAVRRRHIGIDPDTGAEAIQESLRFVGQILDVAHNLDDDSLEIVAKDCRHILRNCVVFGRYELGATTAASPVYREGEPSHFNPGGRPNCVFNDAGIPLFSPNPDFGLLDDQSPLTPEEARKTPGRVCDWTFGLMMEHLRMFWGPTPGEAVTQLVADVKDVWPHIRTMPDWIVWPVGLGTSLDTVAAINFNSSVGQTNQNIGGARKGRDINIDSLAFCGKPGEPGIFDVILEAAGGYSWTTDYIDTAADGEPHSYKNLLRIVPVIWRDEKMGFDMPFAIGGNQSDIKIPVVTGGIYRESAEFTATRVVGRGARIKIETRCSMDPADHVGGTPAIVQVWDAAKFRQFRIDCVDGGAITPESWEKAVALHWDVMSTWALNSNFDFQQFTSEENKPRAKVRRPIWPFLLSFTGGGSVVQEIMPFPIRFEVHDGSAWTLGPEQSGLEVWDNGMIYAPMLRDCVNAGKAGCFRWTDGVPYSTTVEGGVTMANITLQNIRLTMAIPCDHRLQRMLQLSSDGGDSEGTTIAEECPDEGKFAAGFVRQISLDLNELYQAWLRVSSWPEPAAAGSSVAMAENRLSLLTSFLRSDRELLHGHVLRTLRENGRLSRAGSTLIINGSLTGVYTVGTQINNFIPIGGDDSNRKPYPARFAIVRRRFLCERDVDKQGRLIYTNKVEHYPN